MANPNPCCPVEHVLNMNFIAIIIVKIVKIVAIVIISEALPELAAVQNPTLKYTTLRSGKEFGAFDLAVYQSYQPIKPPKFFDIADCLSQCLREQETLGNVNEPDETIDDPDSDPSDAPPDFWINPTPGPSILLAFSSSGPSIPSTSSSPIPPHRFSAPPTHIDYKKASSKAQQRRHRAQVQEENGTPGLKQVIVKRQREAMGNAIQIDINIEGIEHSGPAWIGSWTAETVHEDGMAGPRDLIYINWGGMLSIPIIDSHGRIIAILGGTPRDMENWKTVTDGAAKLMEDNAHRLSVSEEQLNHCRAYGSYPSIARVSHGGGQTEPGNLQTNKKNKRVMDELLAHEHFNRLSNSFWTFAPLLATFFQVQMGLLAASKPSLVWNFAGSVFAACTFNFGPHAITVPHLDFANLAWGWCAITALGRFNPDRGGHLILWDLKLVIQFPLGSTVLIPPALIHHSNVPIAVDEFRASFTQYTAGGLFRWIRNGFKTDEQFERTTSVQEKEARAEEAKTRWEDGVSMYSTIDSLLLDRLSASHIAS
ncbi:hypothetical protein MVEN_00030000 [Mycena venus]|uniref:Uncharacterized protein n=1 Tax=Mycena venus TaxID=2733690 RepID=A0A8H6Z9N9_9AGAR|nr:hypothetical protein MVEN_00030000 [Mycena venus]